MKAMLNPVINRIERLDDSQFAYLMLLPSFIIIGGVAIWPMLTTIYYSFFANPQGTDIIGEFVGLKHYIEILDGSIDVILPRPFLDLSQPFNSVLTITFIFAIVSVVLEGSLGFIQALILDREFRGRSWVRVAVLIPWAVPIAIQGMIFYLMFTPGIGFGADLLSSLGMIYYDTPVANPTDAIIVLVLADMWKRSAFVALIVLAGLQSIDRELYNVAKVTGASKWERFKTVTFPLVLPALLIALLFRTIGAIKVYGLINVPSNCATVPSLTCVVVQTFRNNQYPMSAAIAVFTSIIIGIMSMFYLVKYKQERS